MTINDNHDLFHTKAKADHLGRGCHGYGRKSYTKTCYELFVKQINTCFIQ